MKKFSFMDPRTGVISQVRITCPDEFLQVPDGMVAIEGAFDHLSQRVDLETGLVVDYQPPKPADTEWETFHWRERRWMAEPTTAAHWRSVRSSRDALLAACDWVVTKAAESGKPVPAPWVAYRQMLRDITLQPDPLNIHWPEAP